MLIFTLRKDKSLFFAMAMLMLNLQALASGSINLSASSLPHFREVYPSQFSDVQFYYVAASDISQDLTISVEGPFRISLDCTENFGTSLSLSPVNGNVVSKRIYVRFFPESTGEKQGNITHQAGNAGPVTLSLAGRGMENAVPEGYYNSATGQGSELKTQLFDIINNHQAQTYSSLWSHMQETDATFAGNVWDMYSDKPCEEPPYTFTFGEDQDSGSGGNVEGQFYNREHSVPQSWFEGAMPMYTDMFHIFPTDKMVNAKRGNYPYGEVNNPSWTSENGSKLGPNTSGEYSGTVFEPIDTYKGDVARGYFYMVTRYEDDLTEWISNGNAGEVFTSSEFPGLTAWALEMFLEWHSQDPVSQKEILRNQAIYEIQGNRNPFIDHPEFASYIWDENNVSAEQVLNDQDIKIYPNPLRDGFIVEAPGEVHLLEMFSLGGSKILSRTLESGGAWVSTSNLEPGFYLLIVNTKQKTFHQKILVQ